MDTKLLVKSIMKALLRKSLGSRAQISFCAYEPSHREDAGAKALQRV